MLVCALGEAGPVGRFDLFSRLKFGVGLCCVLAIDVAIFLVLVGYNNCNMFWFQEIFSGLFWRLRMFVY